MMKSEIINENKAYWTNRAKSYSEINRTELATLQKEKWRSRLLTEIEAHFSREDHPPERTSLSVLEVGTGPGFLAILLAEAGFSVTAVDLTPAMLAEAAKNAACANVRNRITFLEMNAEALAFSDATFDLIVSRNLTWDLPHPKEAYREWLRVLKPGGLLLNFDANWYHYLFYEKAREGYLSDREASSRAGIRDKNVGEHFDVMEDIARRIPLSKADRPAWDIDVLHSLGASCTVDPSAWEELFSEEDKINFSSTPLFLLRAW